MLRAPAEGKGADAGDVTASPVQASDVIRFRVAGVPAPQGSKTVARSGSGRSFVREDNPALAPWRNAVAAAAQDAMGERPPIPGPVYLEAVFRFPRPLSHFGTGRNADRLKPSAPDYVTTRPDLDKLLRALGDALAGIVFAADAYVVTVYAEKVYGSPGADVFVHKITRTA